MSSKFLTGYAIIFDAPDSSHRIYAKDSIKAEQLDKLVESGNIESYEIDDIGVKITKKIDEQEFIDRKAKENQ